MNGPIDIFALAARVGTTNALHFEYDAELWDALVARRADVFLSSRPTDPGWTWEIASLPIGSTRILCHRHRRMTRAEIQAMRDRWAAEDADGDGADPRAESMAKDRAWERAL